MKGSVLLLLWAAILGAAVQADDSDHPAVTCGSAIKITSVATSVGKYLLYDSEGKNRGGGSGQHLATWVRDDPSSTRSLWWVRPAHHGEEKLEYSSKYSTHDTCRGAAQPVKCGDVIRLTNLDTKRTLHSHNVVSPLSKQQEVTVFDGNDSGDDFRVECTRSKDFWKRGESVRLQHVATRKYLGGSKDAEFNEKTCGRNCPLMNHLESFARGGKDGLTEIQAEQGIYLNI